MPYIISAIVAVLVVIGAGFGLSKYYTHTPEPINIEVVETSDTAEEIPDVQSVAEKIAAQTKTTPKATPRATVTNTPSPTPTQSVVNTGTPPVISAVRITGITSSGALVSWTTNTATDTQVEYGPLTTYGSLTTLNTTKSTSHSAQLTGLTSNRTYHVRVKSRNAAGAIAVSADYSFDTYSSAAADEVPEISEIAVTNITSTSARITWDTDIDADGKVEYGKTTAYASSTSLNSSETDSHTFTLSNLLPDTTYNYRVRSKTSSTTEAVSSNRTFKTLAGADTTPPQISGINITNITETSVRIKWVTNEPSDEAVEWGLSTSYGTVSSNSNTATTSHSVMVSGLAAGQSYHYRVRSIDSAGNTGRSGDLTFTTEAAEVINSPDPDVTPPTITSINMTPSSGSITVDWVTADELSDSTVYYRISGSGDTEATVTSATMTNSHHLVIVGLSSDTAYAVRVSSKDALGNTANSTAQVVNVPQPSPTASPS